MSGIDIRGIDDKGLTERTFPKVRQELRIVIDEAAFDRVVERGSADMSREIGGILVGELARDAGGPFLHIQATIDALHAEEKGAELTFTHATWEHINKELDSTYKGKKVVGWYHTHPGFGIFLSDRDQFIQRSFFNLPFQIALVYDPKTREHGLFTWRDNEPYRHRRWFVGEKEQSWDGARSNAPSGKPKEKEKDREARDDRDRDRDRDRDDAPPVRAGGESPQLDWMSLAIGAAVCLLLGGIAGWYFGGRGASDAIAQADKAVAQAKAAGAQEAVSELNPALLGALRSVTGGESGRELDQAFGGIDESLRGMDTIAAGNQPVVDAFAKVKSAIAKLRLLEAERASSVRMITQLESFVGQKATTIDPRDLYVQRHALADLYADLAADAAKVDVKKARRMLVMANTLDPNNRQRYETILHTFDKDGTLGPAPEEPATSSAASSASSSGPATAPTSAPASSAAATAPTSSAATSTAATAPSASSATSTTTGGKP